MTIRRTELLAALAVLGLVLTLAGSAQQADPGVLLRAAIEKEDVAGDLEGAMALYRQIITEHGEDRPVAARALLRLGGCHEKLGQGEARKAYERLVTEYSDQAQEVAQARDRLAAISRTARELSREPRFRKVVLASGLGSYPRLSPDGQEMAFTDRGGVWVVPLASRADPSVAGIPEKLTGPVDASAPAWSPDGRSILFRTPSGISSASRSGGVVREIISVPSESHFLLLTISVSRDGTTLAYSRVPDEKSVGSDPSILTRARVFLAGPGRPSIELPVGAGNSMPAFSPDGRRLAYVHVSTWEMPTERLSRPTVEGEVWIVPTSGGDPWLASKLPGWPRGPVWSPDGRMIAFLQTPGREDYGNPELRILTVDAGGRPVGTPARITLPFETYGLIAGWTTDNKIALVGYRPEEQAIYVVPAAGGRAAQVSSKGWRSHPRWSRDGTRIYLRRERGEIGWIGAGGGDITPVRFDTATVELEATPGGGNSVSPDGTTIVFSGGQRSGEWVRTNIWAIGVEGGQPKQLTDFSDPDTRFPCWSPDGRRVAFIARDADRKTADAVDRRDALVFQVYVVSADGTGLRKVTSESHHVDWSSVAWSPDGRWIAFFSRDKTLSLVPAEGGAARVVADLRRIDSGLRPGVGSLSHSEVAWSPDGKVLAFSFQGRVWTVGVEGGAVTEVRTSLTGVRALHLDWSPDGRTIAFTGSEGGDEELWLMEDFLHLVKTAR